MGRKIPVFVICRRSSKASSAATTSTASRLPKSTRDHRRSPVAVCAGDSAGLGRRGIGGGAVGDHDRGGRDRRRYPPVSLERRYLPDEPAVALAVDTVIYLSRRRWWGMPEGGGSRISTPEPGTNERRVIFSHPRIEREKVTGGAAIVAEVQRSICSLVTATAPVSARIRTMPSRRSRTSTLSGNSITTHCPDCA